MAIVKTTTRESEGGGESGEETTSSVPAPRDPTRSAVAQRGATGGIGVQRPRRTPGQMSRQQQSIGQPSSSGDFVRDTVTEVKRVVFPTQEERVSGTIVTIGLLVFFALYLWGLETIIRSLFVALGILPPDSATPGL